MSIQIQRLEAQLGHPLFDRLGRRLVLTEAGKIVIEYADTIFRAGEELLGVLGDGVGSRRVLRVGALATLSRNFQLRFLRPLLKRDDIEVVLRSGSFRELLPSLEAHRLDVLLTNSVPARDASTTWVPHAIAEQPVSLVGHPRRARKHRELAETLEREPLIVPAIDSSVRTGFDALVLRLGVRPRIVAEVDDMAMMRLLAREDIGLAVVPSIVVKDELETKVLIKLVDLRGLKESFFAITPTRRFLNPLLQDLLVGRPKN